MAVSTDIFDGVDLSRLPAPQAVEQLDYQTICDALTADFVALYPEYSALTPADPAIKLIELAAYRELLLRQRINEAATANMVAFANGADLDHLGARVNLERWIITPADPANGRAAVLERDEDFRARIIRAPEGWSCAGPTGAYVALATEASSEVRFASCFSPAPCQVVVSIQSMSGDGTASPSLIAAVFAYLNSEDRRPLTDQLTVQSAAIKPFAVVANIRTYSGPAPAIILDAARAKLRTWLAENERLGRDVTADGIFAQLRVDGVSKVELVGWADIICNEGEAGHCTGITLHHVGAGE